MERVTALFRGLRKRDMCGIAGIYNYQSGEPVSEQVLRSMLDQMAYRGPDDEGVFVAGPIGLGHRRLSILDTSSAGHQPMLSPSKRTVIVHNGEVYNYVELAKRLAASGVALRSRSDTEVILAMYEAMGENCVSDFIGMFAFAIWDQAQRRLCLIRDRLGIKPLYWTHLAGGIAFASEIKALLAIPETERRVEVPTIECFFRLGYVPGDQTMFKGIRKLMPGHFLTIEKGILQIEEYWNLSFQAVEMGDAESRAAQLLDLLKDSVRLHLRSDVPLGVFLSGGLDSSTMVALAKSEVSSSLKTYSVAFDMGRAFDERQYARTVAETFRTEHHEIVLTPKEFQDLLPTFVWHMDEPVSEAPAIQLYCVAKLAANDVKVVLSGEGADELFGGYDIYRYMLILERLRGLGCEKVFRWAKPLAKMFGVHKVEKYLSLGVLTLEERYAGPSMLSPMNWSMMYNREFLDMLNTSSASDFQGLYYMHSRDWDHLSRMLYLDTKMWLPNDLLIKADKMTMAHSLELRVPFLDHRVVEFAANLPSHDKLTMNEVKRILKQAMNGILPEKILSRKKMGFPTPIELMLKGPLLPYVRDLFHEQQANLSKYFRKEWVSQICEARDPTTYVHYDLLWRLVVLAEWHRVFRL